MSRILTLRTGLILTVLALAIGGFAPTVQSAPDYDQYLDAASFDEWPIAIETGADLAKDAENWKQASAQLEKLRSRVAADFVVPQEARDELSQRLAFVLSRYDGTKNTAEYLIGKEFKPRECLESLDADAEQECAWTIFDSVAIPLEPDAIWTAESLSRFAGYLRVAHRIVARQGDQHVAEAAASLDEAAARWQRYIEDGYSQYPWELLLNGAKTNHDDWSPSATKWILLHPSVGVVVGHPDAEGAQELGPVLVLEGAGLVRYAKDFSSYWGLSGGLTLQDMQWDRWGLAAMVHWTSLHVGTSFGIGDEVKDEWSVFVTFDAAARSDNAALRKKVPEVLNRWLK